MGAYALVSFSVSCHIQTTEVKSVNVPARAQFHEARQFTDTANFTLRCLVCQLGVKGEKEAMEHAKASGHQSFGEY